MPYDDLLQPGHKIVSEHGELPLLDRRGDRAHGGLPLCECLRLNPGVLGLAPIDFSASCIGQLVPGTDLPQRVLLTQPGHRLP
jgi:hypothetical protein